jgi:hypothetical protein
VDVYILIERGQFEESETIAGSQLKINRNKCTLRANLKAVITY